MVRTSNWRALILSLVAPAALACCAEEEPAPTEPRSAFMAIELTPASGVVTWEPGQSPGSAVRLTPGLSWTMTFVAARSNHLASVVVRLRDAANTVCFVSEAEVGQIAFGFSYHAASSTFRLPPPFRDLANPCGEGFAARSVQVEVVGITDNQIQNGFFPTDYEISAGSAR